MNACYEVFTWVVSGGVRIVNERLIADTLEDAHRLVYQYCVRGRAS